MTKQELIDDIQAETGEATVESMELTGHLVSAESCETIDDLKANLLEARKSAETILMQINDQLARLTDTQTPAIIYDGTPLPEDHVFEDDCERVPPEAPGDCPMGWDRV